MKNPNERLRAARERRGVSEADVVAATGYACGYYDLEGDPDKLYMVVSLGKIGAIREYLGVTP